MCDVHQWRSTAIGGRQIIGLKDDDTAQRPSQVFKIVHGGVGFQPSPPTCSIHLHGIDEAGSDCLCFLKIGASHRWRRFNPELRMYVHSFLLLQVSAQKPQRRHETGCLRQDELLFVGVLWQVRQFQSASSSQNRCARERNQTRDR